MYSVMYAGVKNEPSLFPFNFSNIKPKTEELMMSFLSTSSEILELKLYASRKDFPASLYLPHK